MKPLDMGALRRAMDGLRLGDPKDLVQRTLARHGLVVHPLSQLLDCPSTADRLADRAGATPVAVFRVGRPLRVPVRSARGR